MKIRASVIEKLSKCIVHIVNPSTLAVGSVFLVITGHAFAAWVFALLAAALAEGAARVIAKELRMHAQSPDDLRLPMFKAKVTENRLRNVEQALNLPTTTQGEAP